MKQEISPRYGLRLINTGPAVVATCGPAHSPNGIALAWCMPVSHKPPMAAVSVAPQRYSHGLIEQRGCFCVNVPSVRQLHGLMIMGTRSGRDGDKFAPARFTAQPAETVDTVFIEECPGHIECVVRQAHTAGDHTIFVGEILRAFVESDMFDRNKWTLEQPQGRTVHHLGEEYFGVLNKIIRFQFND